LSRGGTNGIGLASNEGLGVAAGKPNTAYPAFRSTSQAGGLVFAIEGYRCPFQQLWIDGFHRVDIDSGVRAAVDLACDHGDRPAHRANVKVGCLRAEGLLRDTRLVLDLYDKSARWT